MGPLHVAHVAFTCNSSSSSFGNCTKESPIFFCKIEVYGSAGPKSGDFLDKRSRRSYSISELVRKEPNTPESLMSVVVPSCQARPSQSLNGSAKRVESSPDLLRSRWAGCLPIPPPPTRWNQAPPPQFSVASTDQGAHAQRLCGLCQPIELN